MHDVTQCPQQHDPSPTQAPSQIMYNHKRFVALSNYGDHRSILFHLKLEARSGLMFNFIVFHSGFDCDDDVYQMEVGRLSASRKQPLLCVQNEILPGAGRKATFGSLNGNSGQRLQIGSTLP